MKIVHFIDSAGVYGAEVVVLDLIEEQRLLGHDAVLASIVAPGDVPRAIEREARGRGLPVERMEVSPGLNPSSLARFSRFSASLRADVIHTHGYKANVLAACMPRRLRGGPVVATLHGWTSSGRFNRNAVYESLERALLHRLDAVVIVADRMRRQLKGKYRKQVVLVPNGIPVEAKVSRQVEPLPAECIEFCLSGPTIISVGRLSPEKRQIDIVRAVGLLASRGLDVKLLLVGDGPLRQRLEAAVHSLGLWRQVLMPGYVPAAWRLFPYARAFVLSSETEGLPISILEAMRAGLPIVSTSVGDIPTALVDGQAGCLVKPGDVGGLAAGIMSVLRGTIDTAALTASAKNALLQSYTVRAMTVSYLDLYRRARIDVSSSEADGRCAERS